MIGNDINLKSLTPQQREIATAPADVRMLVLAGPGTGKTHTLIHRLSYLVESAGLLPTSDILVLSFSRAAIAEIKMRLEKIVAAGQADDIRFLNVRTFDSFATRFMTAADESLDLSGLTYDSRIKLAVARLSDPHSPSSELLEHVKHVIVDEIQDLVGVRARLVQIVLERTGGGFTLLGDPAQGIFDYLVSAQDGGPSSVEFIGWLRSNYSDGLRECSLEHNHRAATEAARVAARVRSMVLTSDSGGPQALGALKEIVTSLPEAGSVQEPVLELLRPTDRRTVILCRTNAEVLFTANRLQERGLSCIIPPKVEEKGLPAWLARVLGQITTSRLTQMRFEELYLSGLGSNQQISATAAWELLKALENRDREDLDLVTLRLKLHHGTDWAFDSEAQNQPGILLTTTIHQAKGHEYQRVVILSPELSPKLDATASLEEARVLYVAATRCKEDLFRLDRHGLPVTYTTKQPSGRDRQLGQNRQGRHFFEVVPADLASVSHVSTQLFPTEDAARSVQEFIWKAMIPGTELKIVRETKSRDLRFTVVWENPRNRKLIPLGAMNDGFKADLEGCLRSLSLDRSARYKSVMSGLVVFERRTVVLPPYPDGVHYPFINSGFCLGLGVKGLLEID